jgi:hypothetical protein
MFKNIILLLLIIPITGQLWSRIPKFEVDNYVLDFLNSNQINDCFFRLETDTIYLKCLRDIELIDIKILLNLTRLYS